MPRSFPNLRTIAVALALAVPAHAAEPPLADMYARFDPAGRRNVPSEMDYPEMSRRLGEEGDVYLALLVHADGAIKEVMLERSSGFPKLDDAAIEFYHENGKVLPAVRGGKKVASWKMIKVSWKLKKPLNDAEDKPIN